ncbi:MAG: exodeoxyribonuclease VII small subunit [Actinomycetota bacterium]|nr:exodeoxyribonuclease VII small subunit [Actinomycetota bacterium]
MSDAPKSNQTMPYEQARDELIQVVQKLETGGTTLEESLSLWERGEQLAAICQQWLDGARARLAAAAGTEGEEDATSAG